MTISTKINIDKCYVHRELFDKQNVLFMVDLNILAENSETGNSSLISKRAAVSNYQDQNSFIEFENLNEEQIISWVNDFYPSAVIEEWKQEAIDSLNNKVYIKKL